MPSNEPTITELLAGCQRSAVHLEMREQYGVVAEASEFRRWRETGVLDLDPASPGWGAWVSLVTEATARGVTVKRARIVSEPVTEYIRWEHAGTVVNVDAGEQVRWLPRRCASTLALPGNDFWLFDDRIVRWGYFSGDGELVGHEVTENPETAAFCAASFAAVWDRAVPHDRYELH